MAAMHFHTNTHKKDAAGSSGCGRSLIVKVLPARHQRVETLLQRDDLKCHVTGGEDENADAAKGNKHSSGGVNNPAGDELNCQRGRRGHCLVVEVLVFHVTRGDSHKQVNEQDGV